jgi:hypothetical protein
MESNEEVFDAVEISTESVIIYDQVKNLKLEQVSAQSLSLYDRVMKLQQVTVSQELIKLHGQIQALDVVDQASHDEMVTLGNKAKDVVKFESERCDPLCDILHAMHRVATAARGRNLNKAEEAKKLSKKKVDDWEQEQERKRLDEERRLAEIARKQQEEAVRIAREAFEAEQKRIAAEEEAARLALALEATAAGADDAQVTAILAAPLSMMEVPVYIEPVYVPPPVVAPTFEKASGFSMRWSYSANFNSIKDLVKAAAVNDHFLQYLAFNEKGINALARASKDAFSLPGCTIRKERV